MEVEEHDIVKSNIEGDAGQLVTMNTVYHPKLTWNQKRSFRKRQTKTLKRQAALAGNLEQKKQQPEQQPK